MLRISLIFLLLAGCVETPWQQQRHYADSLRPAEVKPAMANAGPVRTFKVRAYADEGYQAQTPRWNAHIEEQLNRASAVLEAQFGARLELESARPWPREGSSARLADVLEQLKQKDPGAQVDWVIGYTASLDVFSAAQDQLGVAGFFGKHFVLRGMASAAELDAINQQLNLLSTSDREQLVRQRRLHKETSVLLHEWAHTLGAFHDRDAKMLMAPSYDTGAAQFSEASARVVGLGMEYRGVIGSKAAWAKAYKEEVVRAGDAVWDAVEKQHALAAADYFFQSNQLESKDEKRLEEASLREHAGDYAKAQEIIEPIANRYPGTANIQELACAIAQQAHKGELEACRRAVRLDDISTQTLLSTAHLEITSGTAANAAPLLARAEPKLGKEPGAWLWLAQLELSAGALTAADRAADKASGKNANLIKAETGRTRSFIGYPAQPLQDKDEADYVTAALAAHEQIDKGQLKLAVTKALELSKKYPSAPAGAVVQCRVSSRGKSIAEIQRACGDAAKSAPQAFLPQYILGLSRATQSEWLEAEKNLSRAIEIDGSTREVWASLAAVQLKLHETDAARASQAKYKERFGAALVPSLYPRGWAAH